MPNEDLYSKAKAIAEFYQEVKEQLAPYYQALIKGNRYLEGTDIEHMEFEDCGITLYSEEVNHACNCHPECHVHDFFIHYVDLKLTPEEFAAEKEKERAAKEKEKKAAAKKKAEKEAKEKENREREQLARNPSEQICLQHRRHQCG